MKEMTNELTIKGLDDASMACLARQAKAQCVSVPEQARRILAAVLGSPGGVNSASQLALAAEPITYFAVNNARCL